MGRCTQYYIIHICDKVCQSHLWFSLGNPVSSTNKTDRHDIAEILLNVALNTITLIVIGLNKDFFCQSRKKDAHYKTMYLL